jgi:uridine kinase
VDGPPAAGKTTLADELAAILRSRGRDVIRASVESFMFPRAQRYRNGEFAAEANYRDTFDYEALHRVLVGPLGPGGDRRFQLAVYDDRTDCSVSPPVTTAAADAVLIVEGVFLLRPELVDWWDLRIFVSASFDRIVERAMTRDRETLGSGAAVEHRFRTRYIPAQEIYFAEAGPADRADIVVHNDEPLAPAWEVRPRQA